MDIYSVRATLTDAKTNVTVIIERKCNDDITVIPKTVMKIKCGSFEVVLDDVFVAHLTQNLNTVADYNDQKTHDEFVKAVHDRDQMMKNRLKDHNDNKETTPYMFTSVWDNPNATELIGTEVNSTIQLDNP